MLLICFYNINWISSSVVKMPQKLQIACFCKVLFAFVSMGPTKWAAVCGFRFPTGLVECRRPVLK